MSIWIYREETAKHTGRPIFVGPDESYRAPELEDWDQKCCRFCDAPLETLRSESSRTMSERLGEWVEVCPVCGWWRAQTTVIAEGDASSPQFVSLARRGAMASLQEFDLADVTTPVGEVRKFLLAKYEARFEVHPTLMEETVASVFRGLGYSAQAVGRSGDDGIDVILERAGERIGVQVKRYKNSIQVEQIRALTGALVLGGLTRGIFVTTSTFQRGAPSTAERLARRGYPIELVDAPRFYEMLQLAERTMYASREDFDIAHCVGSFMPLLVHNPQMPNPRRDGKW